eukprot:6999830-Prymnesium_polylepis.2
MESVSLLAITVCVTASQTAADSGSARMSADAYSLARDAQNREGRTSITLLSPAGTTAVDAGASGVAGSATTGGAGGGSSGRLISSGRGGSRSTSDA